MSDRFGWRRKAEKYKTIKKNTYVSDATTVGVFRTVFGGEGGSMEGFADDFFAKLLLEQLRRIETFGESLAMVETTSFETNSKVTAWFWFVTRFHFLDPEMERRRLTLSSRGLRSIALS